ncbi:hypothetical protein SAMN05421867_109175 [Cellulomonas marina]|uniref:DUF3592 domain-containing protein n=2 Tax=Cellulomonas marina TaxID=988821 RepID=A0A1I0Z6V2_9CELL|nr:hypothetical protein SAMN05421867_109175 [Cellulomonas marina]
MAAGAALVAVVAGIWGYDTARSVRAFAAGATTTTATVEACHGAGRAGPRQCRLSYELADGTVQTGHVDVDDLGTTSTGAHVEVEYADRQPWLVRVAGQDTAASGEGTYPVAVAAVLCALALGTVAALVGRARPAPPGRHAASPPSRALRA